MGVALGLVVLSLLSELGGPPPADPPLGAGEAALLRGDLEGARRALLAVEPSSEVERARRARLLFELSVLSSDRAQAERWADELRGNTGWGPELERGFSRLERIETRMGWARAGVFCFALAFGVLLLGGGRELLRPRLGALLAGLAGALGVLMIHARDPVLGLRLGMTVIAATALLHAAEAASGRQAAGPKWRLILGTCVLVGTAGVALAAFVR